MKKIVSILFLSLFLYSCGDDSAVVQVSSTPEEMGEALFEAIKTEDAATVRTYFAVESDLNEWLAKSSLSEKQQEKKLKKLEKKITSLNDNIAKTLAKIHQEPIDWNNSTYDWIDYKNFEKDGTTGADVFIVFSVDRTQYEIKLDDCFPTSRGWVLFDNISFKGARKEIKL